MMLMVQLRGLSAIFFLFLLLGFTTLQTALSHSAGAEVAAVAEGKHVVMRELRMNHGSFRGPRKHLLNPTAQRPFEAQELPAV